MGTAGRRALIGLVVVVALLIVSDRVGAHVLAGQIATRAQRAEGLADRPDVSIDGFPFLTQVISGRYHDVKVRVRGFQRNGPRVESVDADLKGVHVPFSDGIQGRVRQVPVDSVSSHVHVTFADINTYLSSQGNSARVAGDGNTLRISGPVALLGTTYTLAGNATIGVASGDTVTLTPAAVDQAVGALLPPSLRAAATDRLTLRFPVQGLPFNLHVRSAEVDGDGLTFTAGGTDVILTNTRAVG